MNVTFPAPTRHTWVVIALFVTLITLMTAFAQANPGERQRLDLIRAYEAALIRDNQYRAAQAARDAGREEAAIGRAGLLPSINAVYGTDRNRLRTSEHEILRSNSTLTSTANTSSSNNSSSTTSTSARIQSPSSSARERNTTSTFTERTQSESDSSVDAVSALSDEALITRDRIRSTSSVLELRQPLMNFGLYAAYRQGLALTEASEQTYRAQAQELILRVAETYAAVLLAQESRRLAHSQLQTLELQQRINERMLEQGEGTITDVLETRARRQLAQAQMIEAEDEHFTAINRLTSMTGLSPTELEPLREDLSLAETGNMSFEYWRSRALEHNGTLLALQHRVKASHEAISRAESAHLPTIDLTISLGRNLMQSRPVSAQTLTSTSNQTTSSNTTTESEAASTTHSEGNTTSTSTSTNGQLQSTGQSSSNSTAISQKNDYNRQRRNSYRIGLELNIPLFSGGGISARARQAVALHQQTEAEAEARTEDVLLEVHRQWRLQQSAAQRARALEQAVQSSRVGLDATLKSMSAGVRTNLDVINARERLVTAERELLNTRYTHLLAFLRLRLLAGTLSEAHLREVTSLYH